MHRVTKTSRGKPCIFLGNYKFRQYRKMNDGNMSWRCTVKACAGKMITNCSGTHVFSTTDHNHEPKDSQTADERRDAASSDDGRDVGPSKTIEGAVAAAVLSEIDNTEIRRTLDVGGSGDSGDDVGGKLPSPPQNAGEAIDQCALRTDNVLTDDREKFVHVMRPSNVLILTTERNLRFLCDRATVLADGTASRATPLHFSRLYTLHAFENGRYFELVFCVLPNRTAMCYREMWASLVRLCDRYGLKLCPKVFQLDFERAAHDAIRYVFPKTVLTVGAFHLGQALLREIQSLGLKREYASNTSVGRYLKQFFGLSFLPPYEVEEAFLDLLPTAPADPRLSDFLEYLANTYVGPRSLFPPFMWAKPPSYTKLRATHGPDSYHKRLTDCFRASHPSVHELIDVLVEFQSETNRKLEFSKFSEAEQRTEKKNLFVQSVVDQVSARQNHTTAVRNANGSFGTSCMIQ